MTSSDLRVKAALRDANSAAGRRRLLADNGGNVYRRADRAPNRDSDRNDAPKRASKSAKTPKSRTTPLPRSRVQNERQEGGRASDESKIRRTRQSAPVATSRQLQTQAADRRASQRSVRVAEPRAGARKPDSISAPVRTVQAGTKGNNSRQRSSRVVSAPVQKQKQQISRPGPPPQGPGNNRPHNSASVERAPQRSAKRTSGKRNGANAGTRQRATGDRPKRH